MASFRLRPAASAVLLLGVLSGVSACAGNRMNQATGVPAPLPAAPSRPAQVSELPPPGEEQIGPDGAVAPATDPDAAVAPAPPNAEVARESLLGSWRLASGAENCALNLTLTGWTGGYRANTRGCLTSELQGVNAWSFEDGGRVVLRDAAGGPIINLAAQSGSSMSGATTGGASVSASR